MITSSDDKAKVTAANYNFARSNSGRDSRFNLIERRMHMYKPTVAAPQPLDHDFDVVEYSTYAHIALEEID